MLKIALAENYAHPLPPKHRFPMIKYELLPEQLIYEGTISVSNLFTPLPASPDQILKVHTAAYWEKLKRLSLTRAEERKTGFPLSEALVNREITIMGGTLQAAGYALEFGIAMNIAGGTHHAYADRGEGFCLLNDIAIAAKYLLDEELRQKILVVDLDVHQGNGTAAIFQNEPRVFTFSMHGEKNYPLHKERSDLDIGLPDGTSDAVYLKTLEYHLNNILDTFQPDMIFFQSGVDVLANDKLGRLGLSMEGCKQRDQIVLSAGKRHQIPIVASMGGGYSENLADIIEAHANTYRLAQDIFF
jgi:acetoin utilization deacetylase AcuC-like enzyme